MLFETTALFVRRCRRLICVVATILGETLYLNLTLRRQSPDQRLSYRAERQSAACRRVMRIWGIEVRRIGEEPPSHSTVVVSNHLGVADGFAISATFSVAISGKAELLRTPVIGWVSRSIAMIPVFRERRLLTADFADEVAARLDAGVNVLVFPEGTTVPGAEVMPFKTGGFAAIERTQNRSALPITLVVVLVDGRPPDKGMHALFTWADPKQSLFNHFWSLLGIRSARIDIVVGHEVAAAELSRKELADRCHEQISSTSMAHQPVDVTPEPEKPAMSSTG